ncbi:MAG: hypothetical protein AAF415_15145 [Pseudomonadota bacterium]
MQQKSSKVGPGKRIIICCYCDARSILPREAGQRLVCHGCGAPIRRVAALEPSHLRRAAPRDVRPAPPRPAELPGAHSAKDRPCRRRKHKKGKRRPKGLLYRFREAIDDVLDFDDLDELFDLFD